MELCTCSSGCRAAGTSKYAIHSTVVTRLQDPSTTWWDCHRCHFGYVDQSTSGGACAEGEMDTEDRAFYEGEDVDFARRVQAAGHAIEHESAMIVFHDDPKYKYEGKQAYQIDGYTKLRQ